MRSSLIMMFVLICTICAYADEGTSVKKSSPENIHVEDVGVSVDYRLKEGFDYSEYYGVIRSEEELKRFWSEVVDIRGSFLKRFLGIPPERPEVDFERHMVIWFAHRGAKASFAKGIEVARNEGRDEVNVTVTAYHSDFGSDGFDLWKIPVTDDDIVFNIVHEYEKRGP